MASGQAPFKSRFAALFFVLSSNTRPGLNSVDTGFLQRGDEHLIPADQGGLAQ